MARAWRAAKPDLVAVRAADAVIRARAMVESLAAMDGRFPNQPLRCYLARRGGVCRRVPLDADAARRVAFITPRGPVLADIAPTEHSDGALAAALVAYATGPAGRPPQGPLVRVDRDAERGVAAAAVVSMCPEETATARHLHRRAWSRGGGPWIGVGATPSMEVVTTCHMVVDGYGHTCLSSDVFRRVDRRADRQALIAAARVHDGHAGNTPRLARLPEAVPLGIAVTTLDARPWFSACAYAMGRALERWYGTHVAAGTSGFSPTFQIPIAPGPRDDPDRLLRRVIYGLMSLRIDDGAFESFSAFGRRVPQILSREAAAEGLAGRVIRAATRIPVPTKFKHRFLGSATVPLRWLPLAELLAGRSHLSLLKFLDDDLPDEPLYAVSAPTLDAEPGATGGGNSFTIICYRDGLAISETGTGVTGTREGAQAFLDDWLTELSALEFRPREARQRSD
jgi:hypothetical protein